MATTISDQLRGQTVNIGTWAGHLQDKTLQVVLGSKQPQQQHNNNKKYTPPPPKKKNKLKESAILMVHGENLECYGLGKETISPLKYVSLKPTSKCSILVIQSRLVQSLKWS